MLRIEDTDLERSSESSADGILRDMAWLGLDIDEGPFYQMQRMPRYREVVAQMLADGRAYHCYMSVEELDAPCAKSRRPTTKAALQRPLAAGERGEARLTPPPGVCR